MLASDLNSVLNLFHDEVLTHKRLLMRPALLSLKYAEEEVEHDVKYASDTRLTRA